MKEYHYIGLDVHKRTIAYCIKNAAGKIINEGSVATNRRELGDWATALPFHTKIPPIHHTSPAMR